MKLKKFISSSLVLGLLFNSALPSYSSTLSEDGRYETFKGNNITIDNVLEEEKVDVEIEGNTMVNVANQKDAIPVTKNYTVEGRNHIPLQGDYDGKARPAIEGNTMYYNNDTGELSDTFVEGANLSLVSSFEDQLVTQEMIDNGEEKAENLGKYKVECKITGKNKFDLNNIQLNSYQNYNVTTGLYTITPNTQSSISGFISVKPNTTYSIQGSCGGGAYYTVDKEPIKGLYVSTKDKIITTPNNCYYIVLNSKYGSQYLEDLQIEEGSNSTEYEAYKESIKTFYLNSPLLEGDTIEDINGKATHVKRSERVVFDGNEYWHDIRVEGDYVRGWTANKIGNKAKLVDSNTDPIIISDNFLYIGTDSKLIQYNGEGLGHTFFRNSSDKQIQFKILSSKLSTLDIEGFKSWLQSNPTAVVYELESPIYETISEESILIDSYKDGHLDLNSNIPVNKIDFISTNTNLNYLYPSTEYIVQFKSDNIGEINKVLLGDEVIYSNYSVINGINRFNITTSSIILSTELTIDGIGFNLSYLVVAQATDEYFNYFEEIKSVGQDNENGHNIEISSNKKLNYCFEIGALDSNGNNLEFPYRIRTSYIDVNVDMSIYISKRYARCAFYDDNLNLIHQQTQGSIIVPKKASKMRISFESNNVNEDIIIGYQCSKSNILLQEPLRALSDEVKDKIIKRNGQWVIERNTGVANLNGTEGWIMVVDKKEKTACFYTKNIKGKASPDDKKSSTPTLSSLFIGSSYDWLYTADDGIETSYTAWDGNLCLSILKSKLSSIDVNGFNEWLSINKPSVIYQLAEPIYEPLSLSPELDLYLETTHLSNNSDIPANMKVTVDRAMNRAAEAIELAKTNPTTANISQARMWANLLKESTKKDEFQNELNNIISIEDLEIEKKTVTANLDVYVKSENALSMSLSTNSVTFEGYNGTEDLEKNNAVDVIISSSLPYDLNAYLEESLQNSDKSSVISPSAINIKESSSMDYNQFMNTTEKVVLKSDCEAINNRSHSIDLKLSSDDAHKADIYKAVIKFEIVQK